MNKLKVIIDSNVLVSILKGSEKLLPIYLAFRNEKFLLVVTPELIKELADVLYRPKLGIDSKDIKALFRIIKEKALYVTPKFRLLDVCRDPKDEFILCAALEAKTDIIVTGDKDLLALKTFRNIPIITPRKFIELI